MSKVGNIMSTLGVFSTLGGYHEYTGGYHDKCRGRSLGKQLNLYGNPGVLNIPRCTHDTPSVLNTLRCTAQTLCRVITTISGCYWMEACSQGIIQ